MLLDGQSNELTGTHALKYVQYGEREGYHETRTNQARVNETKSWYELRDSVVEGDIIWPKAHQYRHIVTINNQNLPINCRLYAIKTREAVSSTLLGAILNSTLVAWFKEIYGRVMGREGNTDTMVFEVKQMLVVDPTQISDQTVLKLQQALQKLKGRAALPIYPIGDELNQIDRVELDNVVFEALGVTEPAERDLWREALYEQLKKLYRRKRDLEEIAMENRRKAARSKRTSSARSVAKELWREIDKSQLRHFQTDFMPPNIPTKTHRLPAGKVQIGRELFTGAGMLGYGYIQIGEDLRYVGSLAKAEFCQKWQEADNLDTVDIPEDDKICQEILTEYQDYKDSIEKTLYEWVRSRTADERMQQKVVNLLWQHINEYVLAQVINI